ncbi:uncharacterized protein LOC107483570 [Arachis duranensis]|uniref:Uncharacterized protein LOC107483570 n=1 Tax=Arachis duranensis TaxID=130453 RepID=A0A6P4CZU6_ARADU|nr:uncharacterized protein LOC107483570 [Arachis duranensis]
MDRIRRKLNFEYMFCVEPRGLSGGLSLIWKSNININIYEWCDNYIKANININHDLNWQGIFVYGNPVFQKRRKLWQELTVSNMDKEVPQAYLGDFNDILYQDEKVGIHPQPRIYLETFRRFVADNGLIDIDLKGSKYTWFSNPRNNIITRKRLDRVLVNWKWLQIYQNVILRASPAVTSDHCALILDTQQRVRIKKDFRFEAYWTEHEECKEVIKRSWQREEGGRNCWNQFTKKRNRCIRELVEWSKRKFKRAYKEIERKKTELHQIQEASMTEEEQKKERELRKQIAELWKQEEKYWGQRSRLKWLKWGDKNTAFFHATTIQRRLRNRIEKLKDETGQWIQGETNIMRLVERHFTKLFTSEENRNLEECVSDIPRRITREMNEELMANINDEEIKEAVFSMGGLKAPGPDGLNGLFFQQHWEILSKEVCDVVKQIFREGSLPEDLGETTIVLIPKTNQPESLNQLRPISCCNFMYKIVTRILVGRLRRVLDAIISPVQCAFVKGRLIQDNIVIVQEAFHKLNKKGNQDSNDIAIKLDMNKAYDRLEWNFIQRVMEKFGFNREWVRLIMSCVKSASYRFKINGKHSTKIIPKRGLRQGDPLSPYLFILAAEWFTVLMDKAREENLISGIRLAPTAPVITHLLFADDCIIFAGAQEEEIYQIIQIINKYTEASGQRINTDKSGLIFGRQVSIQRRVNIEEITGMASWEDPGRYLGLPARWGRSKNKALEWIQEKMLDKMQGWKEKLLNQAVKEILIKAVIQAIPVYAMNIIKFPKSFCKRIEAAVARFWWKSNGKERSIHWQSWVKLTRSKNSGGLGFKDLECQNIAQLAKQAWRMLKEEDAIWVRILKAIYYPNCSLWEAREGRSASWIWRSLLEGRDFLRRKGSWSIGNGTEVDIWEDNWVAGIGKLRRDGAGDTRKVSELIIDGEGWDRRKIHDLFQGSMAELITKTPISLINKKDHFVWKYRMDGQYTVRTGYHVAKEEKDLKEEGRFCKPSTSQDWREVWKVIWKLQVPQKVRMFLWKAVHRILPVNKNLHQKRITVAPTCSICQREEETIEHALLLCPWTRAVWFGSNIQIVPTAYNVRSFGEWILDKIRRIKAETGTEQEKILSNLGCLSWCIWKARNQYIFQHTKINPQKVIIQSELLTSEYQRATQESSRANIPDTNRGGVRKRITWRPPPKNRLKVNTDAAFHRGTSTAALAAVVRDWQGKVITGITATFKTTSPLTAEAQAYREALILIKNIQIPNCLIETDCLPLVQAIKARTPIVEADAIIRDILQLLEEAPDVGATWTPRDGNKLAHQLAAMAAENNLGRQWTMNPPIQVRNIIRSEATLATIQHHQNRQIQGIQDLANNDAASTTHQQMQMEETLPGGLETETRDKPSEITREQHHTKPLHLLTRDSHESISNRASIDRGGGIVAQAEKHSAVSQIGGSDDHFEASTVVARQIRVSRKEGGAAPETGSGRKIGDEHQGVWSSNRSIQHKTQTNSILIGIGRGGAPIHQHASSLPRGEGGRSPGRGFEG